MLPPPAAMADYSPRRAEPGKGKASTRAKSGCWTCRIRRKKCDEIKTPEGYCQTCVRLRLECLGWGSRRPDWMREKNNVLERREKIKEFLATNGMIKGHAGSISRTPAEAPPEILALRYNGPSPAPRGSVPGDSLAALHDHDRRPPNALHHFADIVSEAQAQQFGHMQHAMSSMGGLPMGGLPGMAMMARSPLDMPGPMLPPLNMSLAPHTLTGTIGRDTPLSEHMGGPSPMDPALAGYNLSDFGSHQDSDLASTGGSGGSGATAVDSSGDGGRSIVSLPGNSPWVTPYTTPSIDSSFGRLYTQNDFDELDSPETATSQVIYTDPATGMTMPALTMLPMRWVGEMPDSQFVFHYLKYVLPVQYLLADQVSIRQWTYHLAQNSESTRSALCLLAALHQHCMSQMSITGPVGSTTELDVFYSNTRKALQASKTITEGDAMASLHVISSFLFAGGRGPWHDYLEIACRWVQTVLQDPSHGTPRNALRNASASVRFIIRATFWFDCLAAISQLRSPQFLHIYRDLFGTPMASIDSDDPDVSMMDVMGCSATGFLSLAEIANLAHWKEEQRKLGKLSYPLLVERGRDIETRFLNSRNFEPGDVSYVAGASAELLMTPDGVEFRRRLVSNVFRASAKVYLHSVISGGFPETPEIASGVQETINCLKAVPGYSDASRVVVRSVVFSICIAGCMTDNPTQQQFFLDQLQALGKEAEVLGNCSQARKLMQQVWAKRQQTGGGEVQWRESMFESGPGILLLA